MPNNCQPSASDQACLAIDIGGTNLRLAVVSRSGRILLRRKTACASSENLAGFLASLKSTIETLQDDAAKAGITVAAIGAGVPGLIASNGTIASSVNLQQLADCNLRSWLSSTSHLPATILNDANAAAIAEHRFGAGRPFANLLHYTLGTGVGSGLILNNVLWTGSDGYAAEFGHCTVEPEGYPCNCGNRGCLEQYASATGIVRMARELISSGTDSRLNKSLHHQLSAAEIAVAATAGDPVALACFANAGRYLGIATASAVNLLNLEAVIIGGGVAASFDLLESAIRKELNSRCFAELSAKLKLLPGELGDDSGILGAAAAAWELVSPP